MTECVSLQAKDEFQQVMIRLTEERVQHDGAIQEYKQVAVMCSV